MNQRTKIRQSALLLIYATLQSGEHSIPRELFWSIAQEKQRGSYINSLAKSLLHVARSSTLSFELLSEAVERIMRVLEGDMINLKLRESLERYYAASQKLETALATLSLKHSDKRYDDDDAQHVDCLELIQMAHVCLTFREQYNQAVLDFPAYASDLSVLENILTRRARMEANLSQFRDMQSLPAKGEFAGLVQSYHDLSALRPEVEALALPALDRQAEWDERITPLLKHYSVDRLDVLDRAILYLSLYELTCTQLPLPIVISEATSLANIYSGSKSAPFIHGVLAAAAAAQNSPQASEENTPEESTTEETPSEEA